MAMAVNMPRVANGYPAGRVTRPVTTASPDDRPLVTAAIEWDDGRVGDAHGVALSWSSEAVQVMFTGPDGLRRQEWMPTEAVRRR
jgi:hypothetical protein